jgi:hypothetical protein
MIGTLLRFADQVSNVARDVGVEGKLGGQADVPGAAGIWRDLTNNVNELAGNLTRQVRAIGDVATAVTKGDLTRSIDVEARGEVALLKDNINQMIRTLAETTRVNQEQDWLKTNLTRFTRMLQGQRDLLTLAQNVLSELAPTVDAQHGSLYMMRQTDSDQRLKLFASYAFSERKHLSNEFELGQGLIGQAAFEKKRIVVKGAPTDYIVISSGLGEGKPANIVVVPILFEGEVKGVLELASFHRFSAIELAFLDQLLESLGIVIATIEATMRTDELLRESQSLAEELQTQQEELQQTNEELEEKARQLAAQKAEVERKNREVEIAKQELEEKAEQLSLTSRYKSEFLANMSHELRTPLNSLLILSHQLATNPEGNLSERQVQYSRTINESGADLLAIINEILDLAKIESGTMSIEPSEIEFAGLETYFDQAFRQVAEAKDLAYKIESAPDLPPAVYTDDVRLRQVLRNLLANAFKFTEKGTVTLRIAVQREPAWSLDNEVLNNADSVIAFSVTDTGVGIAKDKQRIIFEAFQQADGSTSRRFGGTGLGLSISREIANLLGGELRVKSEIGRGSTFTLYLPRVYVPRRKPSSRMFSGQWPVSRVDPTTPQPIGADTGKIAAMAIPDDRLSIQPGDPVLLIVEDDDVFARILLEMARARGFRGVVALSGRQGLELARAMRPDAITLDLRLPDMDGWVLLDMLKRDPDTRHIPVHIISALEGERRGLQNGALAFLQKPIDRDALDAALSGIQSFLERRVRRLLIAMEDDAQREQVLALVGGNNGVQSVAVQSGEEAMAALEREAFDCLVLDLRLSGMSGLELVKGIKGHEALKSLPIIVYTSDGVSGAERVELERLSHSVIIKDARTPEHLVDETALFLHRPARDLGDSQREMLRRLAQGDPTLSDKTVLVVDDDVRNIFAITAVLEQHQVNVVYAENGRQALDKLEQEPVVDVILMDIMMPEMDGYEAMRRIRTDPRFARLPIIALTAKAMKGDREKCIQAGASDYIPKPVDAEQLISLLRVWLYRDPTQQLVN